MAARQPTTGQQHSSVILLDNRQTSTAGCRDFYTLRLEPMAFDNNFVPNNTKELTLKENMHNTKYRSRKYRLVPSPHRETTTKKKEKKKRNKEIYKPMPVCRQRSQFILILAKRRKIIFVSWRTGNIIYFTGSWEKLRESEVRWFARALSFWFNLIWGEILVFSEMEWMRRSEGEGVTVLIANATTVADSDG